jgi:hypothetical protein
MKPMIRPSPVREIRRKAQAASLLCMKKRKHFLLDEINVQNLPDGMCTGQASSTAGKTGTVAKMARRVNSRLSEFASRQITLQLARSQAVAVLKFRL